MKDPWNVDVRYADGRIFSMDFHYADSAREIAKRLDHARKAMTDETPEQYRITGIMVWKCRNGIAQKAVVVYGEEFTY